MEMTRECRQGNADIRDELGEPCTVEKFNNIINSEKITYLKRTLQDNHGSFVLQTNLDKGFRMTTNKIK